MTLGLIATQWTTPQTAAQRPWILWADWNDVIAYLDVLSVRISDSGGNTPARMEFDLVDRTNTLRTLLAKQMRVMYVETQANANAGQILFHGFIKYLIPRITATYARWHVICADVSENLDFGFPIVAENRGAEFDDVRIGAIFGQYCTWPGMLGGGFVQRLGVVGKGSIGNATVRSAMEDTIRQTGVTAVGYYVDFIGPWLHTYSGSDAGAAPYAISDTPNYTTTIPAALEVEDDGSQDTDAIEVLGATAAGSGIVGSQNPPRYPHRIRAVDAQDSTAEETLAGTGLVELYNAQNLTRVSITVSADSVHGNFGGWAKGQSLAVTNAVLGWVAEPLIIMGVDMRFLNGKGDREYRLTCGYAPMSRTTLADRVRRMIQHQTKRRHPGSAVGSRIGSAPVRRG